VIKVTFLHTNETDIQIQNLPVDDSVEMVLKQSGTGWLNPDYNLGQTSPDEMRTYQNALLANSRKQTDTTISSEDLSYSTEVFF